ncbi:multidrug efflux SMR transporter [Paenibacillus sp. KS-LC4]|uniref:DMT family transporter n=1 Tax=Paenibacillus sp. KS-LC4 TaxID=2979727 RepID=UPI0030CFFF5A
MGYVWLALAIVLELSGTISMKLSASFTRVVPSIAMFIFYGSSFTCLNFALRYMHVSVAYAVWSGIGITLITGAGYIWFGERIPLSALLWVGVIVIGVVGLNMSISAHGAAVRGN